MAVKTDISKAYDRLEWSFIKRVLERMGFCEVWISWVMQCITTVSYSFLVDSTAVGTVTPQRGIRQGDPLSPYIFILCGEVLSGLCKKAQQEGTLAGIRVSNHSPRINHLLFADDTMFFTKSNPLCCATLLQILQDYEYASGQKINSAKSSISFSSKTPQEVRSMVKLQLGIDKEGGVGKYLGLPEHFGRKKRTCFRDVELFNIALLGKIAWRILTKPHCLLSRILLGKYCHSKSFLSVPSQGGSSHGWKGIIAGRDLLISHLGKSIGDGESTKVWKDSWIDNGSNTRPFGPSTLQDQDLLVADLLSRETREWNVAKINKTLPELAERILQIRPSRLGTHDTYIWNLKSSGEYTTKTWYMALTQNIAEVSSPSTTNSIDWRKNRLLFEKRISTPEEALIKAIKAAREWEAAQLAPQKALKLNLRSTPEKKLPPNTITCNTDTAWIASSTKAGFGWIFFDSSDMEINRGSSNQLHVSSACMAEALAVREALLHASSLGFTKIWLRSDSQVIMRAINQKRGPTELFGVLSDIVSLSSSFQLCCFSFLPRDLNGLANSIDKAQLCA
ncbi:PREDICTED: uncharacterized protein LOC106331086 [Brassica oleracea var. oleracea]|uniref:uncharacterized protein LOC106331086 n=1 Tax=Brassica oleracea var. oleracea TaxID=109376 RepID=UPI0006A73AA0|nr:PREDICTED: uncharacterized protein LOC106331086 [Brassica oleracea var. oleracea]